MNEVTKPKSKKIAVNIKGLAPCNNICPAGEDIQRWITLAKEEKYQQAWEVITQNNPFPAIHGRVCYHYCETRCNRINYDSTVGIHCIERYLGDLALEKKWEAPKPQKETGKKILVVGAGPAGLSAAYHLRQLGHSVTIYEALPKPGGTMLVGIPAYRLPREVLFGEIDRVLNTGIKIEYNRKVDDVVKEKKEGGFHAVFLAIGAHLGKNIPLHMEDPCLVTDAVDYLREVSLGAPPKIGPKLAIYGGGNTAIDVARTARRFGINDITIIYHRTREKMSAFEHEIEDALAEGIKFTYLRSITALHGNKLTLSINELDEKGRSSSNGKAEEMETDTLVFALSQIPDSQFLTKVPGLEVQPNGVVTVDNFFMTGADKIFAGGDMVPFERSVTIAVGQGRKSAYYINSYLNDEVFNESPHKEVATFEKLNINSEKSTTIVQKELAAEDRINSFDEIAQDCSCKDVSHEASRCFSCGNCFGCGKCYAVCPVNAISYSEVDGRVTNIDPEKCIGCTKCVRACPCGAIVMSDRSY